MKNEINVPSVGESITTGVVVSWIKNNGDQVEEGVRAVKRFVEKPDFQTAKEYVAAGNFTWNSGMFFFTAKQILEEIARQMPALKVGLDEIDSSIGLAFPYKISFRKFVFRISFGGQPFGLPFGINNRFHTLGNLI